MRYLLILPNKSTVSHNRKANAAIHKTQPDLLCSSLPSTLSPPTYQRRSAPRKPGGISRWKEKLRAKTGPRISDLVENSKKASHKISTFPGDEVLLGYACNIRYKMGQVVPNPLKTPRNTGFKKEQSVSVLIGMRVGAGVKADGRKGVRYHNTVVS